jgi:hypothetical protein
MALDIAKQLKDAGVFGNNPVTSSLASNSFVDTFTALPQGTQWNDATIKLLGGNLQTAAQNTPGTNTPLDTLNQSLGTITTNLFSSGGWFHILGMVIGVALMGWGGYMVFKSGGVTDDGGDTNVEVNMPEEAVTAPQETSEHTHAIISNVNTGEQRSGPRRRRASRLVNSDWETPGPPPGGWNLPEQSSTFAPQKKVEA